MTNAAGTVRSTSDGAARSRPMGSVLRRSGGAVAMLVAVAVVVTASASGGGRYTVRPGDTLSAIAARYHTSVAALVRLNHLPGNGNLILAGSSLRLPGAGHAGARADRHTVIRTYVVRPGDSLYAIAARYKHAGWRAIARRNHLPSSLVVVIGQHLKIPQHVRGHAHTARGVGHLNGPVPSRDAVAGMIRATAARWGVDQRFALAISYEEAGFNQSVVSPVGAVGAMQIMPETGRWLSSYVVHRPLDIRRAQDNVTAGVALLSVLMRETGGNMRTAAAGYYQGLASVHERGMYDDTKQYVANVLALRNRF
jgi:LysM repeat protein